MLFAHQKKGIADCLDRKNYALFWEQGTGKSRTIVEIIKKLKENYGYISALIVCPNFLKENWGNEIEKFSDLSYTILKGTKLKRIKELGIKYDIYIINYESLLSLKESIIKKSINLICFDESTYIKNKKAKRTKIAIKIAEKCKYKYILTGTPTTNSPLDIWSQFLAINADLPFKNWTHFLRTFAEIEYNERLKFFEIKRYKNLDYLNKIIVKNASIIKKEECLDLPEKTFTDIKIDFTTEQKKIYNEIAEYMIYEFENNSEVFCANALTKLLKLQQITSGFVVTGVGETVEIKNKKYDTLYELTDILDGKIVIWCRFLYEIKKLQEYYKDKCVCFCGNKKIMSKYSNSVVDEFNNNDKIKIFIGQIQASKGITLTTANKTIYFSKDFSLENYLQSQDRIHRIGQTKKCTYYNIYIDKSIDTYIQKAINNKQKIQDKLLVKNKKKLIDIIRGNY